MYTSASSRKKVACNRLFGYNLQAKELGTRSNEGSLKTKTGSILHALIEARHLGFNEADTIEYAKAEVPDFPTKPDKGKNKNYYFDYVVLTYIAYCSKYPLENEPKNLTVFDPETGLNEPYLEKHWKDDAPKGKAIFPDQGFIDRAFIMTPELSKIHLPEKDQIDEPEIWCCDYKSTSMQIARADGRIHPEWKARFAKDIQMAMYMRFMRENELIKKTGLKVAGFMIDSIQHPKRQFNRLWFKDEYTVEKCDEIIGMSDEKITEAIMNPDVPNFERCNDYGGCEFWSLCHNPKYSNLKMEDRLPKFLEDKSEIEKEDNE